MSWARSKAKHRQTYAHALLRTTAIFLSLSGQTLVFADDSSTSLFPAGNDSGSSSASSGSSESSGSETGSGNSSSGSMSAGSGMPAMGGAANRSTGKGDDDKPYTPVNPLNGLFQPQPQYPTPGTTQMFPSAVSPNMGNDADVPGRQPGQAGKIYQVEWKDPYAPAEDPNKKITPVNPLNGLFQQQPQYPTPGTTQMFPEAVPQHLGNDADVPGRNPGQAGKIFQVDWKDPYAEPEKPVKDKENYLKGLFQQQPQYVSPNNTLMFPEAIQKNLGDDANQPGKPGIMAKPFETQPSEAMPEEVEQSTSDNQSSELGASPEVKQAEDKKEDEESKENEKKKEDETADNDKNNDKKEEMRVLPLNPLNEAVLLMSSNKIQDSIDILNTQINKHPKSSQAFYLRAVAYVKMRKYDLAAADYNQVLKLAPLSPMANLAKTGLAKIHF